MKDSAKYAMSHMRSIFAPAFEFENLGFRQLPLQARKGTCQGVTYSLFRRGKRQIYSARFRGGNTTCRRTCYSNNSASAHAAARAHIRHAFRLIENKAP